MCPGYRLLPIDSIPFSRLALGAVLAILTPAAPAAERPASALPAIVHPTPAGGAFASSPFASIAFAGSDTLSPDAPTGTGQRVVNADGAQADFFGWSVAVDGDTAIVGAYGVAAGKNQEEGAAYVFTKTDGVWNLTATLTASDGNAFYLFGERVALAGNVAAIGAYQTDSSKGAVYVFSGHGTHWTQKAKLSADDGARNDCLGWSVAVAGTTVLAGAPFVVVGKVQTGAIYAFAPSGGTWTQTQKFYPDDITSGDGFGSSVAAEGTIAVVGADGAVVGANVGQGAAYVYDGSGGSWTQEAKLTADDGVAFDNFGRSVAVSGSTVMVGAPYVTIDGNGFEGAVYVFDGNSSWRQHQKLVARDGAADGYFGWSIALDGDNALIGAGSYSMARAGSAYAFARASTVFGETHEYVSGDTFADDFGWTVSLSGSEALIGEPFANVGANYAQGAAFFYTLAPANDEIFANGFD